MKFDEFKSSVEERVVDWFAAEQASAPTNEARLLLDRMCALIMRGGKRLRPQLLYMTYVAYGGLDPAKLIDLALVLEFHHQFLLIHDDIIDNDTVRYDGPNIVGYYQQDLLHNQQNIPETMGLLAGDLLFSFANQAIVKNNNLTSDVKLQLLERLHITNIGVIFGQQLDAYNIDASLATFTEDRLTLTHSLKSALYSVQLPMQCAAVLLNLDPTERARIDKFAVPFGILFQLADDYSDYFSNDSAFNNRPKYRDFRQGKITYPLYLALNSALPRDREFLKRNLGNKELSDAAIKQVVAILKNCGAQAASRQHLDQYFQEAYAGLTEMTISETSQQQFIKMIDKYRV